MNDQDKDTLKFIAVLVMIYGLRMLGLEHSMEYNNAVFLTSLYSILWTILLFTFSGLTRRRK